jgi:hypothetical protein
MQLFSAEVARLIILPATSARDFFHQVLCWLLIAVVVITTGMAVTLVVVIIVPVIVVTRVIIPGSLAVAVITTTFPVAVPLAVVYFTA